MHMSRASRVRGHVRREVINLEMTGYIRGRKREKERKEGIPRRCSGRKWETPTTSLFVQYRGDP